MITAATLCSSALETFSSFEFVVPIICDTHWALTFQFKEASSFINSYLYVSFSIQSVFLFSCNFLRFKITSSKCSFSDFELMISFPFFVYSLGSYYVKIFL